MRCVGWKHNNTLPSSAGHGKKQHMVKELLGLDVQTRDLDQFNGAGLSIYKGVAIAPNKKT